MLHVPVWEIVKDLLEYDASLQLSTINLPGEKRFYGEKVSSSHYDKYLSSPEFRVHVAVVRDDHFNANIERCQWNKLWRWF